jgi:formamidopyrimidine-DNA glycosylase
MIELPEAAALARQMQRELSGRCIAEAVVGMTPHKFAWYSRPSAEYAGILCGKTVGDTSSRGAIIMIRLEPGWVLCLAELGGRVLYHPAGAKLPDRHQILLRFEDGGAITVTIQMWGALQLYTAAELAQKPHLTRQEKIPPLSDDFTFDYFQALLADPIERERKSAKYFMISKPGLLGVGNGCLHDILFRAKIHPKHLIKDFTPAQAHALYDATRETLRLMVEGGGRDIEKDLYGNPGKYACILHAKSAGEACPVCATPIEKTAYLGGAAYFCPRCQE